MTTASVAIKRESVKRPVTHGTVVMSMSNRGTAFILPYAEKDIKASQQDNKYKSKGNSWVGFSEKKLYAISRAKSYTKNTIMGIAVFKGGEEMCHIEPVSTSSSVNFPTICKGKLSPTYQGKLIPMSENEFTLNNDREDIDISHKVEKFKASATYRGRLSVGSERQ